MKSTNSKVQSSFIIFQILGFLILAVTIDLAVILDNYLSSSKFAPEDVPERKS
jgi:hypothetical protein